MQKRGIASGRVRGTGGMRRQYIYFSPVGDSGWQASPIRHLSPFCQTCPRSESAVPDYYNPCWRGRYYRIAVSVSYDSFSSHAEAKALLRMLRRKMFDEAWVFCNLRKIGWPVCYWHVMCWNDSEKLAQEVANGRTS